MVTEHALYSVYILRCSDGSYYVGHANDVQQRVVAHNEGRGAAWTSCRKPVVLVYQQACESKAAAVARERQLKGWTRAKKQALIDGDTARLKELSKRT